MNEGGNEVRDADNTSTTVQKMGFILGRCGTTEVLCCCCCRQRCCRCRWCPPLPPPSSSSFSPFHSSNLPLLWHFFLYSFICVCVYVCVDHRTTFGNWSSYFTMWVLRIELRNLSCQAPWLAPSSTKPSCQLPTEDIYMDTKSRPR